MRMKSASTESGVVEAAGFPSKNGSTRILCPPVSSPSAACPYHVNFAVIVASFGKIKLSIGRIQLESTAVQRCHTCTPWHLHARASARECRCDILNQIFHSES